MRIQKLRRFYFSSIADCTNGLCFYFFIFPKQTCLKRSETPPMNSFITQIYFHCSLLIFNEKDSIQWAMDSRQWTKNCYCGLTSKRCSLINQVLDLFFLMLLVWVSQTSLEILKIYMIVNFKISILIKKNNHKIMHLFTTIYTWYTPAGDEDTILLIYISSCRQCSLICSLYLGVGKVFYIILVL